MFYSHTLIIAIFRPLAHPMNKCKYNRTFLLSAKAVTLIFITGRGSVISSAEQGKSGSNYLVKS